LGEAHWLVTLERVFVHAIFAFGLKKSGRILL